MTHASAINMHIVRFIAAPWAPQPAVSRRYRG